MSSTPLIDPSRWAWPGSLTLRFSFAATTRWVLLPP